MGWWPFRRGAQDFQNEPHIRGSKMWIQDLREVCEMSFNEREKGQNGVERMRLEWKKAHSLGEVDESLLLGLERRAEKLLNADDSEWSLLLDNDNFWKAGWGSQVES
tara:strand:+ start:15115 stop:15435 length:321 start_codon:yes stop_codon:yes gene_type:complete